MKRKHRRRGRQWQLPILAAAILWLVSMTAASSSAEHALHLLGQKGELAMALLRYQLGAAPEEAVLPSAVTFAISQSPLLISGWDAVMELRRGDESDTVDEIVPLAPEDPTTPVTENAEMPEIPLVIVDNGVSARTLVPTSPEGYIVTGGAYIDNRSKKTFDETMFTGEPGTVLTPGMAPQVLIVHTHGSEAYTMPPGEEYIASGDCRTTDENCSVVRVGEEIAAVLKRGGITVLHDRTLHDYPQYSGAYDRSLATIEDYLARYPTIKMVLDVHRDAVTDGAGNMYKVVSSVGGLNVAQMTFVIGTDGGGLFHPDWQENLKLAAALSQTIAADHPTLMRPITVRNSRYNQHTTAGTLLVEMGAAGNSLDEALLSARLLGQAILDTVVEPPVKPIPVPAMN